MSKYSDYYPCIIFMTRYQGTYEGGNWACIAFADYIPSEAVDDDLTCCDWWMSPQADLVGRGSTPDEAYNDMVHRQNSKNLAVDDVYGKKQVRCSVIDCNLGTIMNKYSICSGKCLNNYGGSSSKTTYYS